MRWEKIFFVIYQVFKYLVIGVVVILFLVSLARSGRLPSIFPEEFSLFLVDLSNAVLSKDIADKITTSFVSLMDFIAGEEYHKNFQKILSSFYDFLQARTKFYKNTLNLIVMDSRIRVAIYEYIIGVSFSQLNIDQILREYVGNLDEVEKVGIYLSDLNQDVYKYQKNKEVGDISPIYLSSNSMKELFEDIYVYKGRIIVHRKISKFEELKNGYVYMVISPYVLYNSFSKIVNSGWIYRLYPRICAIFWVPKDGEPENLIAQVPIPQNALKKIMKKKIINENGRILRLISKENETGILGLVYTDRNLFEYILGTLFRITYIALFLIGLVVLNKLIVNFFRERESKIVKEANELEKELEHILTYGKRKEIEEVEEKKVEERLEWLEEFVKKDIEKD